LVCRWTGCSCSLNLSHSPIYTISLYHLTPW
jgi:hypothetical protein